MDHDLSRDATQMASGFLRLLRPHRVEATRKKRIGRFFDGGYVMLDKFDGISAAYSLGISNDVSWDLDIADLGIPVHQFDPTIDQLPAEHALFKWEKLGVAAQADPLQAMETLPRLLQRNGHEDRDDLILKCDIEGFEWGVFASLPESVISRFRQIVVEVHDLERLRDIAFANLARKAMSNLVMSHRVVHVHGNNWRPWSVVGGIPVPSVLELTFARSDQGIFEPSDEIFPTALDMPCNPAAADLFLGRFTFD